MNMSCSIRNIMLQKAQFSSVTQSCPTLCDPMNHSTPGLPVHHQLPETTQTHIHWVGDGIQPPYPLSSPSPPALNLSQHQGLFQGVSSSYQVAKVLEFQLQHQCYQWTPRTDLFEDWLVGSPCSPRDSQESSPTPQFKSINFIGVHMARERDPGLSQCVAPQLESLSHSSASLWARINDLWIYVTVNLS